MEEKEIIIISLKEYVKAILCSQFCDDDKIIVHLHSFHKLGNIGTANRSLQQLHLSHCTSLGGRRHLKVLGC